MPVATDLYAKGPEALVVRLAATGERDAFADLVRRRQSLIRNLMRRCSDLLMNWIVDRGRAGHHVAANIAASRQCRH